MLRSKPSVKSRRLGYSPKTTPPFYELKKTNRIQPAQRTGLLVFLKTPPAVLKIIKAIRSLQSGKASLPPLYQTAEIGLVPTHRKTRFALSLNAA